MVAAGTNKRSRNRATPPKYKVFVSHATEDKWIAKMICSELKKRGVSSFRDDRDIVGGDDIPEKLVREIVKSKELLVILSPKSVQRPWVMLEVGAAWGRGRRIVAILYHVDVDPIPTIIKSKKAYGLNDLDQYISEVAIRAKKAQ
jgi:hypothetical protein